MPENIPTPSTILQAKQAIGFLDPNVFCQIRVLIPPPSPTLHELDYLKHLFRDVSSLIEAISQGCPCVLFFCQYFVN